MKDLVNMRSFGRASGKHSEPLDYVPPYCPKLVEGLQRDSARGINIFYCPGSVLSPMPHEIHKNATRGHMQQGWLTSAHSFSFGNYYNPERRNFGALLVLNEDTIAPGTGFGEHGHDNMEIVTIPLSGSLEHTDSMGNRAILKTGDVQIMSAGTGIRHSEKNASSTDPLHLLQIWILPSSQGLPTRYDELHLGSLWQENGFRLVVSPIPETDVLHIRQDAWFSLGNFSSGTSFELPLHRKEHGMFFFLIEGKVTINGETLEAGDAYALWDEQAITGRAEENARVLAIEVPMMKME